MKRINRTTTPWVLLLCLTLGLTGCKSLDGSSSSGVDPALTTNSSAEFFSKSAWQSCAVGAGVGSIGCILLGGNTTKCLVSAAVGCGIAMGGNYYLDSKRAQYANEEQRLDAYINDVRKNTEEVKAVTETAQSVLNKNLSTLKVLNRQIKANTLNQAEAKTQLSQIDANLSYLNDKLGKMKAAENDWRTVSAKERSAGVNVTQLDQQINQLNRQIVALEKQINLVTQQRSAVRVA